MDALLSASMSLLGQAAHSMPQTPPQPCRRPMGNLTNVCAWSPEWSREPRLKSEQRPSTGEAPPSSSPPTPMTNLKLLTTIAAEQLPGPNTSRKALFPAGGNAAGRSSAGMDRGSADCENRPPLAAAGNRSNPAPEKRLPLSAEANPPLAESNNRPRPSVPEGQPAPQLVAQRTAIPITPHQQSQLTQQQCQLPQHQSQPAQQPPLTPLSERTTPLLATPVQQRVSVFDTPESLARPGDAQRLRQTLMTPKLRWKKHTSDVLPMTAAAVKTSPPAPSDPLTMSASKQGTASRKDKSLSVLCAKFLEIYPLDLVDKDEMVLPLDETALMLGTERRRIYDIVNVLESLHFSIKLEKNRYVWVGRRGVADTLGRLKGLALQLDMPSQLRAALAASDRLQSPALRRGASEPLLSVLATPPEARAATPFTPATPECLTPRDRGDRTLGVLTQKFVMLLLISDLPWLSQDVLARVLLGQDGLSPDGQHKAKVRRLYDIANILQSVGLVGKETNTSCRRPMFSYTGESVQAIAVDPGTQRTRHSLITGTPLTHRAAPGATRSADHTPRTKQPSLPSTPAGSRPLTRPPSLDDICRVTAVERQRLFGADGVDGSRGKSVLKRRLAEVQRAQAEVKRTPRPESGPAATAAAAPASAAAWPVFTVRPAAASTPGGAAPPVITVRPAAGASTPGGATRPGPAPAGGGLGALSPAQHSQLRELGIRRILIRSGDGTSQEICVRDTGVRRVAAGAGAGGASAVTPRLEAALRGGGTLTPRQPRVLAPRQPKHQVVAYQLVPVVRTVSADGAVPSDASAAQTPVPVLYDELACLPLPEGSGLEAALSGGLTPAPAPSLTTTPETLVTPGTMTFIREAVSSGTIKACMALTPDAGTPREPEPGVAAAARGRSRPGSRASRRLQME